jgi:hypothetical protein
MSMKPTHREQSRRPAKLERKPNGRSSGPVLGGGGLEVVEDVDLPQPFVRPTEPQRAAASQRMHGITAPAEEEQEQEEDSPLDLPSHTPAPVELKPKAKPEPVVDPLQIRALTIEDLDRLWDWVRQDADRGSAFFGFPVKSSVQIHQFAGALLDREKLGLALVRSFDYLSNHIGFAILLPIFDEKQVGVVHLYLCPQMRGQLPQFLPALVHVAGTLRPDLRLVVLPDRPEWARLLAPLGFRQQIVLIRD